MKVFAYHENASGKTSFTKTGDAWRIDSSHKIFAVADSPLRCLIRDTKEYPFDDHGYEAADTFCKSFVKYGEEFLKNPKPNKESFKKVLIQCNKEIEKLNKQLGKKFNDKLNYDLAETVGIGMIIKNNKLFYGGLEDCYVNVLRGKQIKNLAGWEYQIMKAGKYIDFLSKEGKLKEYIPKELNGKIKKGNEWEPCWCNYLRNNSNAFDINGNLVGWGCFTGEKEAEYFIQSYSIELKKGDHVLLFSDGMIPVLSDTDFLKWFLVNKSNSFYFHLQMREKIQELLKGKEDADKEKTLLYFQF
jgi:hypothetical protein